MQDTSLMRAPRPLVESDCGTYSDRLPTLESRFHGWLSIAWRAGALGSGQREGLHAHVFQMQIAHCQ